jgi:hypothetical protein
MESLVLPGKRWGVDFSRVHFDDYSDWDKPKAKLEQLSTNCPYRTIIIDSITSIGDAINRQTLKTKGSAKKRDGSDRQGTFIGSIPVNDLQDYKAEASAFTELIAMLKDIHKYHKVHVILIAHVVAAKKDNEENKLTTHARTIVTGGEKISAKIPSYCTEVYHFNIESGFKADAEGQYGLFTIHTGNDYARTSLPLDRRINFNDAPLYERWVKPAIEKLKAEKPAVRIGEPPTETPPSTPSTSFVR